MKLVNILSEIKVNAPRPFVYDAYYHDEDHDDSTEGELYFNGELLDGDAVYSYGISDGDKIYYIAFYLDTPTYARLFDKLSPYIHDKIIGINKRTLAQITDYPDNYKHSLLIRDLNKVNLKNLPPFINEIIVNKPGKPFKFVVTKKNTIVSKDARKGELYFKGKLIDDDAYFDGEWIIAYVDFDQENLQKDMEPYISVRLKRNQYKNQGKFFRHTRNSNGDNVKEFHIEGDQLKNHVDMVDDIKEIKVNTPGLVSTLKNYQRQILSSDDVNFKTQLVIKGAELVLPIFEKKYPNDNRPRKAIETIKAYLLDPTDENLEIARDASNSTAYSWEQHAAYAAIYANEFVLDWAEWEDDDTYAKASIANAVAAAEMGDGIPVDEIKVNVPGLVGKLESYKHQIESTGDLNVKKELALKCAELVLPIFEKQFPNDKRPHKAIKAAKNYILNPTEKNLTTAERAADKSEDAAYIPGTDTGAYSAVAYTVYWVVETCIGFDYAADLVTRYAIKAAKLDTNKSLDEIKVLNPTPKFTGNEQLGSYLKEHPKFRGTLVDKIVKDIDSKPYPHLTDQQWLDIIQDWKTRPEGLQYKQYVDEITLYSELGVNLYLSLDPMEFQDGAIVFGTNTFNYEYTIV